MLSRTCIRGQWYAVVPWWNSNVGDEWTSVSAWEAREAARAMLAAPHGRRAIADLDGVRYAGRDLERRLAHDITTGVVAVLRQNRPHVPAPGPATSTAAARVLESEFDEPTRTEPSTEPTFVEFQLLDLRDEPIAHARYEAVLPDGSHRSGTLDAMGFARIDDIVPAGQCEISFPELDETYWQWGWGR